MRVVHYLNQFFGGLGGEEKAGLSLEAREGAVGPGRPLEQALGSNAEIVTTLVCGDNYAAENLNALTQTVLKAVKEAHADLFIAGPCFEGGRYGVAAGALCSAVQSDLRIPAVTAMSQENPGVDLYRHELLIVDSGSDPVLMGDVLTRMVALASKLLAKETPGRPLEEGYFPQGILRDEFVEQTAAERLVDMALAKALEEPFESELVVTSFEPVVAPPPLQDLSKATIAVVTDGGLVPKGNPDKIPVIAATSWGAYSVAGLAYLRGEDYEIAHRGYDTRYVQEDPDRLVPLDVLRELEQEGVIGKVLDTFFSTSGLANPLENSRRLGKEMVERLSPNPPKDVLGDSP